MSAGPIPIHSRVLKPASLADAQNRTAKAAWRPFVREGSYLLADAVGTGKSYVALSLALGMWRRQRRRRVPFRLLVLAGPLELGDSWIQKLAGETQSGQPSIAGLARRYGKRSFFDLYLQPVTGRRPLDVVIYHVRYDWHVEILKEGFRDRDRKAFRPRVKASPGRIEVLVTSPSWASKQLLGRARHTRWAAWMKNADVVIADEIFGARNEHTVYGRLLRPCLIPRAVHRWRHRRPRLIGLSATLLSRDLDDARAIFNLCLQWRGPWSQTHERLIHDIESSLTNFSRSLRQGLRAASDAGTAVALHSYNVDRQRLEQQLPSLIVRSLQRQRRLYEFWPVGGFSDSTDGPGYHSSRFPLDGSLDTMMRALQGKFVECPRAAEGIAWFIAERSRRLAGGESLSGWTSITESPSLRNAGRTPGAHPKLASLQVWIREYYRENERAWLHRRRKSWRFKLLVYVHHVKTAAELSPRRSQAILGVQVQNTLRRLMLKTCHAIARRNCDLFEHGEFGHPRPDLARVLERHGWTIDRLKGTDLTLLLAACVNAHKSRSRSEKIKRFNSTLRGSDIDRELETYRRIIRALPDLRATVFRELDRPDIVHFEQRRRAANKKLDLAPTAALLDPTLFAVAENEWRPLVKHVIRITGPTTKQIVFGERKSQRGMALAGSLLPRLVAAVRGSERWLRRVRGFRATPRGLARLRRRSEGRHRTPWEVNVQTGQDLATRTFVMQRFRSPGNPFLLVLTNIGTVGVDLHPFCWDIVHYTPEWTPHGAEQKTGRIDRPRDIDAVRQLDIGKRPDVHHIRVHHLVWPFTYDERILSRLNLRAQLAERLLGSKRQRELEKLDGGGLADVAGRFKPLNLAPKLP